MMQNLNHFLKRQVELGLSISNSIENLKKKGKDNYSRQLLNTRLRILEEKWKEFKENNKQIIVLSSEDEEIEYFSNRFYEEIENKYINMYSDLLVIRDGFPPESDHANFIAASDLSVSKFSFKKLPTINLKTFDGN